MVNILYLTQHIKGERELNKVTLYQTTKSEHLTCRDQIELCQFSYQDITPIRDSKGEFIIEQGVKILQRPVQKYVFSQKDWKGNVEERIVYAAFDDELLELIQCERNRFNELQKDLVELSGKLGGLEADNSYLENQLLQSKEELGKIKEMGFWKRLVYLFKGEI